MARIIQIINIQTQVYELSSSAIGAGVGDGPGGFTDYFNL